MVRSRVETPLKRAVETLSRSGRQLLELLLDVAPSGTVLNLEDQTEFFVRL